MIKLVRFVLAVVATFAVILTAGCATSPAQQSQQSPQVSAPSQATRSTPAARPTPTVKPTPTRVQPLHSGKSSNVDKTDEISSNSVGTASMVVKVPHIPAQLKGSFGPEEFRAQMSKGIGNMPSVSYKMGGDMVGNLKYTDGYLLVAPPQGYTVLCGTVTEAVGKTEQHFCSPTTKDNFPEGNYLFLHEADFGNLGEGATVLMFLKPTDATPPTLPKMVREQPASSGSVARLIVGITPNPESSFDVSIGGPSDKASYEGEVTVQGATVKYSAVNMTGSAGVLELRVSEGYVILGGEVKGGKFESSLVSDKITISETAVGQFDGYPVDVRVTKKE